MTNLITSSIGELIRWGIYLILIGEVTACTIDLRQKAGKSLQTGLISIKTLNSSLHNGK